MQSTLSFKIFRTSVMFSLLIIPQLFALQKNDCTSFECLNSKKYDAVSQCSPYTYVSDKALNDYSSFTVAGFKKDKCSIAIIEKFTSPLSVWGEDKKYFGYKAVSTCLLASTTLQSLNKSTYFVDTLPSILPLYTSTTTITYFITHDSAAMEKILSKANCQTNVSVFSFDEAYDELMNSLQKKIVLSVVTLPPMPNTANNNKTVLGVDTNKNGVRDDIERYLASRSSSKQEFLAFIKYSKSYQAKFTQKAMSRKQALSVIANELCSAPDAPYSESLKKVDKTLSLLFNNTPERVAALSKYNNALQGGFSSDELKPFPCKK